MNKILEGIPELLEQQVLNNNTEHMMWSLLFTLLGAVCFFVFLVYITKWFSKNNQIKYMPFEGIEYSAMYMLMLFFVLVFAGNSIIMETSSSVLEKHITLNIVNPVNYTEIQKYVDVNYGTLPNTTGEWEKARNQRYKAFANDIEKSVAREVQKYNDNTNKPVNGVSFRIDETLRDIINATYIDTTKDEIHHNIERLDGNTHRNPKYKEELPIEKEDNSLVPMPQQNNETEEETEQRIRNELQEEMEELIQKKLEEERSNL